MTLREMMDDERERGQYELLVKQVIKKHQRGLSASEIAKETENSEDTIIAIIDIMEKYAPNYDVEKILDELMELETFELN